MPDRIQGRIIDYLSQPASYAGGVDHVARIETHISVIFLVGDRAYKLKRAIRLPYLNFSTQAKRRAACEAEIALNRRTAPELYLGLGAVIRNRQGELSLAEPGEDQTEALDWLVVMRRFAQEDLLDAMAQRGALNESLMLDVAQMVARFHESAEIRRDHGGRDGFAGVIAGNARVFQTLGGDVLDREMVARLTEESSAALDKVGDLLDARRDAGHVRHCHGDLHLRNIFLWNGNPTLFDAIEFSERIACIDVLYDLAFLLMDLEHRALRPFANAVLNRYLAYARDYSGLAALPLFLSCRAAIRSHVLASAIRLAAPADTEALTREANSYLANARAFLKPAPARLVAIGGLSGSGKTTLAHRLAPTLGPSPGAVHLRSDIIRKELMGVGPLTRLADEAYTPAMTRRVYATLMERASAVIAAGHSVVADAVFGKAHERRDLESAAKRAKVDFVGLWLEAPTEIMEQRVARRSADASDATVEVLQKQLSLDPGEITWTRISAGGEKQEVLNKAGDMLDMKPIVY